MNPLEQRVQALEERLAAMERVENVSFIESLRRRLLGSVDDLPDIKLSDLTDVTGTDAATDGQVLKYVDADAAWKPGTDIDT